MCVRVFECVYVCRVCVCVCMCMQNKRDSGDAHSDKCFRLVHFAMSAWTRCDETKTGASERRQFGSDALTPFQMH